MSGQAHPDFDLGRLSELSARYRKFDSSVTVPAVWDEAIVSDADLHNFRGDTPYIWQRAHLNLNEVACALSYYYLKSSPCSDLFEELTEDGAFGALTMALDGRQVSRDLVDSVGEIDFLRRHLQVGIIRRSVIDIGAGYGRLPHRLVEAFGEQVEVFATDAFAASTFLSEYYLAYRRTGVKVLPLDEVQQALAPGTVDIATNIHSFSECTVEAIDWWLDLLARLEVRYLLVTPNRSSADGLRCQTNVGEDMSGIFEKHGYRLIVREPRHHDPFIQRFGLDPCTFFLFERSQPTAKR